MKYYRLALISSLSLAILLCLLHTSAAEIRHEGLKDEQKLSVKVVTPKEMNELLKVNPNAVQMNATRTNINEGRTLHPRARSMITYTLGTGRQTGDSVVSTDSSTNDYDEATTLTVTMKYPSSGTGATITYVEINVYQSNTNGRAYVTSGGIGYTNIVVMVEAYKTYYFDFYSWVYGK